MTESILYRCTVEPPDMGRVRAITESSGYFNPAEIDVAVELVQERLTKGDRSGYYFLFAETGAVTLGYACYGPIAGTESSFDLYWIAVDNDLRGKGIGRELLDHTEEAIGAMHGHRIYVETSSRDRYAATRKFYLKNGYRLEATIQDFYAPGDSKIIYVKEI